MTGIVKPADSLVIYWDASAVLSALFEDQHSQQAQLWAQEDAVHLVSTLAYTEACAVIGRIQREGLLAKVLIAAALETLEQGPWRHLNMQPEWAQVRPLAAKWRLRGADLWHLATAKRLHEQLPELCLLTFDVRLMEATKGENIAVEPTSRRSE